MCMCVFTRCEHSNRGPTMGGRARVVTVTGASAGVRVSV